jgi:hypothetical protein
MKSIYKLVFILLFTLANTVHAETVTRVYEASYIAASQLLSIIKPVINSDIKTSSYDNKIIVNGPKSQVDSVMSTLKELDVPKSQWQVTLYVGYEPDGARGGTTYSTKDLSSSSYMSVKTLNGAKAEISISKTVKDVSGVSGFNTNSTSFENQEDTSADNRADLAGQIQTIENNISNQQEQIDEYEDANPSATVDNDEILKGYYDALQGLEQSKNVDEVKLSSYNSSLNNVQSQSSYNSSGGSINYNYINLPEVLYVTPTQRGTLVNVKVVSVNSDMGLSSSFQSRSINTEVVTEPGQWTQIYGKDISRSQNTYSTETNSSSSNIWVKVDKVK